MNDLRTSIEIAAPPETVWAALTEPAQLASWWGSDDMYRTTDWQFDMTLGGAWSCGGSDAGGEKFTVKGTVLEVDPPRVFSYTWKPSWEPGPETTVKYSLSRTSSGGTLVEVHHWGFGSEQSRNDHEQGWQRVLGWLAEKLYTSAQ